jgi:hypothetical protein
MCQKKIPLMPKLRLLMLKLCNTQLLNNREVELIFFLYRCALPL